MGSASNRLYHTFMLQCNDKPLPYWLYLGTTTDPLIKDSPAGPIRVIADSDPELTAFFLKEQVVNFSRVYKAHKDYSAEHLIELMKWTAQHGVDVGEQVLAEWALSPYYAYCYATAVIGGRWLPGEPAIASNSYWACQYAQDVVRDRWLPGEPQIAKSPDNALHYVEHVIKGPFAAFEEIIASNSRTAYAYATRILGRPWPPGEPAINSDSSSPVYIRYRAFCNTRATAEPIDSRDHVFLCHDTHCAKTL